MAKIRLCDLDILIIEYVFVTFMISQCTFIMPDHYYRVYFLIISADRSSTGLLEWESKGDALEGLILSNHREVPNPSK